ncbi:MAG TPA: TlpA disulfide reductase family protein [Tepidisphaeraceae bacterium]|nr:TlpA disulfide reductase family protein [Tepidisphaeraceae bacterium]
MTRRAAWLALAALAVFCATPPSARAEEKPAAAAPAAPAAGRTAEQIGEDLQKAEGELREVLSDPKAFIDPAARDAIAPKVLPALKKMITLLDELAAVAPTQKENTARARLQFLSFAAVFGDDASVKSLTADAKAAGDAGVRALLSLLAAHWLRASKDEAAQDKVLDDVQKLARANPKNDEVAAMIAGLAQFGAASKATGERAENIVLNDMTGDAAKQIATQLQGKKKMRESVGKPVELAGTTTDGKPFSTKDWKGKVILVDFWATWCGPCIAELPKVKKAYIEHHAKGLEILGVSCDSDPADLKAFLDKNKDMPWPQLFDATENPKIEWHPLARQWGINGIPTMFLIDRNGVLHSVTAREDFETLIPKLLDQK